MADKEVYFSELIEGTLRIQNQSPTMELKNAHVSCSHPLLVNFENTPLFDSLAPNSAFDLPLQMRVCMEGELVIKFLIRYEVGSQGLASSSRFRFQRIVLNLNSKKWFQPNYRINLSSRDPCTHLVNLQMA